MKVGTSLRFLFPTSPRTHNMFRERLAVTPPGAFIERPLGDYDTATQARNWLAVATAARDAGMDTLLVGDNHAVGPAYANCFAPVPSLGRMMAVTGSMTVGMVLLAPFYHPVLLAEQIGTLAAFAEGPVVVTFALGGNEGAFRAYALPFKTRVSRLEEIVAVVRRLLAGERVTHQSRHFSIEGASISPLPRVPVSLWIAGTVPASAERAGRLGDGWLTGQNASSGDLAEQLAVYQEAAARAGRAPRPVLRRDIFVGADDADAEAVVGPVLAEGYRGTGRETLLVGGPETIIQQLQDYAKMGFGDVLVRHITGDHVQMLRSFERIGNDVIPAVRNF